MKAFTFAFSNAKRSLTKKCKKNIALLVMTALFCLFAGCDSNDTSGNISQSTTVKEPNEPNQSEFDFDEAVRSITVFKHEISLPCEIKSLDSEISIDEQSEWIVIEDVVTSNLYYNDKKIGTVCISEIDGEEQIIRLTFGFGLGNEWIKNETLRESLYDRYGWYNKEIEINFNGLNFSSSEDEVKRCLGTPAEKSEDYFEDYLVYEYPDGYIWIKYFQGTVTEFVIGLI